jgi:hypothetical protein
MSALPPKADIGGACWDVRLVQKADDEVRRIAANIAKAAGAITPNVI